MYPTSSLRLFICINFVNAFWFTARFSSRRLQPGCHHLICKFQPPAFSIIRESSMHNGELYDKPIHSSNPAYLDLSPLDKRVLTVPHPFILEVIQLGLVVVLESVDRFSSPTCFGVRNSKSSTKLIDSSWSGYAKRTKTLTTFLSR
jgi:hypothetical protein